MPEENKERTAVWLYPSSRSRMDGWLDKANCKSRSEFIDKALCFYMGYLGSEDSTAYLSKALLSAVQATLKGSENRIAGNLFRLSVETAMMMNILAAHLEISDADLRRLRERCVADVKNSKGRVTLEDAVAFQRGMDEG